MFLVVVSRWCSMPLHQPGSRHTHHACDREALELQLEPAVLKRLAPGLTRTRRVWRCQSSVCGQALLHKTYLAAVTSSRVTSSLCLFGVS